MKKREKKEKKAANINASSLILSSSLKTSADSIISPFLPLYGIELGASPTLIGFIVSITSLLSVFQIVWAKIAEKINKIRFIAIITNYFTAAFNFLYTFVKNIPGFISIRGVQSIIASGSIPTGSVLIAERTSPKDWGFWNSLIQGAIAIGTLIGTLIGGVILLYLSDGKGYFWIFIIAGGLGLLSAVLFQNAIPSKKKLELKHRWMKVEEVGISFDNIIATMKTDKNFIFLSFAAFVFIFGVNLSGPFYIVFNTSTYGLTIFQAALLTSIGLAPQTISSIFASKFLEKARKKELVVLGGIVTSFFPIIYTIPYWINYSRNPFWILAIIWSINGTAWGIINSSLSTLILDVIHPRRRGLYLAIYNSLNSIALFLGPIIGGVILQNSTIPYLHFIISAALRIIGAMMFLFVKEPIIGGTILRPLQRIITFPFRTNSERNVLTIIPPINKTEKEITENNILLDSEEKREETNSS